MPPVHLTHADLSVRLKKTLLKGSLYTLEEIQLVGQVINIARQNAWFSFSNEAWGKWPFADKDNLRTFEHQRSEFDCTTLFSWWWLGSPQAAKVNGYWLKRWTLEMILLAVDCWKKVRLNNLLWLYSHSRLSVILIGQESVRLSVWPLDWKLPNQWVNVTWAFCTFQWNTFLYKQVNCSKEPYQNKKGNIIFDSYISVEHATILNFSISHFHFESCHWMFLHSCHKVGKINIRDIKSNMSEAI